MFFILISLGDIRGYMETDVIKISTYRLSESLGSTGEMDLQFYGFNYTTGYLTLMNKNIEH